MSVRRLGMLLLIVAAVVPLAAAPADASPGQEQRRKDPLESLKPGLPATAVKKALGEPDARRPMASPEGKAEVWSYVREAGRRLERIETPRADAEIYVTQPDGTVRREYSPGGVTVHEIHYVTEDVTEVLLFNDRYVVHKTIRRERKL